MFAKKKEKKKKKQKTAAKSQRLNSDVQLMEKDIESNSVSSTFQVLLRIHRLLQLHHETSVFKNAFISQN